MLKVALDIGDPIVDKSAYDAVGMDETPIVVASILVSSKKIQTGESRCNDGDNTSDI
jgi:hypothetical protein